MSTLQKRLTKPLALFLILIIFITMISNQVLLKKAYALDQVVSPIITTNPADVTNLENLTEVQVTLGCSTDGAQVYYTLDGNIPSTSSTLYNNPFTVNTTNTAGETITVKAIALKDGMTDSAVTSQDIVFKLLQYNTTQIQKYSEAFLDKDYFAGVNLAADENYYLKMGEAKICFYDTTDPTQPQLITNIAMGDQPQWATSIGQYVYLITRTGRLLVIDWTNRQSPTIIYNQVIDSGASSTGQLYDVTDNGVDKIFIISTVNTNTFVVVSVANPSEPQVIYGSAEADRAAGVAYYPAQHRVYVSSYEANKIYIYNINNNIVTYVGAVDSLPNPSRIAVIGDFLYAPRYDSNFMDVFSLAAPDNPVKVVAAMATSSGISRYSRPFVVGKYLYLGLNNGKIAVYDITNPAALSLAFEILYPAGTTAISNVIPLHQRGLLVSASIIGNTSRDITLMSNPRVGFLTYIAGANGNVTGNLSQVVNFGSNGTEVVAVPNAGYHFVDWSDNIATSTRTAMGVTGDVNVTANFALNTYILTYVAGENGSIAGDLNQTINHGSNGSEVVAVPNAGYHFENWSDNIATSTRTDMGVTGDINATANFHRNSSSSSYSGYYNFIPTSTPIPTPVPTATPTPTPTLTPTPTSTLIPTPVPTAISVPKVTPKSTEENVTTMTTATEKSTKEEISSAIMIKPDKIENYDLLAQKLQNKEQENFVIVVDGKVLDNKKIDSDSIKSIGDKLYLQDSLIADSLGYKIQKNNDNGEYILEKDGMITKGKEYSSEIEINGKGYNMGFPAIRQNGKILIPLEMIELILDKNVYVTDNNKNTKVLAIYDKKEKSTTEKNDLTPKWNEGVYKEVGKTISASATEGIQIFFKGTLVDFKKYGNVKPFLEDNRTLVPIRVFAETLGAEVSWDAEQYQAEIKLGKLVIKLKPYSKIFEVNNKIVNLDVPSKIVNGRLVVPLRIISESLEREVNFLFCDQKIQVIGIF